MLRLFVVLSISLTAISCETEIFPPPPPPPGLNVGELRDQFSNWGVIPIGEMPAQDPAKVTLGRMLFFDKIMSGNRDISCATCHQPDKSLTDGMSLAVGTGATVNTSNRMPGPGRDFIPRSAPSLLNSGLGMFYMFWDARLTGFGPGGFHLDTDSLFLTGDNILEAQALLPLLNRAEMRGDSGDVDVFGNPNELAVFEDDEPTAIWSAVMDRLRAIPEYVNLFGKAYPGVLPNQLRIQHAAKAIATFQMAEFTKTDSPFDRYLDRNDAALSAEETRGALVFAGKGQCITCHNGPFLGAQSFANVGAPQIGPGVGRQVPLDLGRGEHDDFEFYRFAFRVAPLRNVELTAPYMHSGAYGTLDAVVEHYNNVPSALQTYDVMQLQPELRDQHHGDDVTIFEMMSTLDHRLQRPLNMTEQERSDLITFLKALTDPAARDLSALTPVSVPSGLPVQE